MSAEKLLPISQTPQTPLHILQVGLEANLQVISYTMRLYEKVTVSIHSGPSVPLSELGWDKHLCNMGLVNTVAALDGFKSNIVRSIRAHGRTYKMCDLNRQLRCTSAYEHVIEPLARRHAITHNQAKVDQQYIRRVNSSKVRVGNGLDCDLAYLRGACRHLFECALEVTEALVQAGFLGDDHRHPIGRLQDGSSI